MQRLGKQPTSQRANPHSCRENWPVSTPGMIVAGSSPLTRGKHLTFHSAGANFGLIPTHAGKTVACVVSRIFDRAHPHSRGENTSRQILTRHQRGSSPLTRGKRGVLLRAFGGPGLIPTHAGKTRPPPRAATYPTAHPHSRGENKNRPLSQS